MRQAVLAFAAIAFPSLASAQETERWLCIADQSTGFAFNRAKPGWASGNFTINNDRFILQRPAAGLPLGTRAKWVVTRVGEKMPTSYCTQEFEDTLLTCGSMTKFTFSKKTLRFQAVYEYGYVEPDTEGADTPSITIGRCSPI